MKFLLCRIDAPMAKSGGRFLFRTTSDSIGIIFDVRSNPGGLLNETLEIADMFLDKGIITVQVDRNLKEDISTASIGTITDLPIVILQDSYCKTTRGS